MKTHSRRSFVQLSAGTLLTAAAKRVTASTDTPAITSSNGIVQVHGPNYLWQYERATDRFSLFDSQHRLIVSGKHQPAVLVAPSADPAKRIMIPGKPLAPQVAPGKVTLSYDSVNGDGPDSGHISVTWRFDEHGIWTDPVQYESPQSHDVVSLHYFSQTQPSDSEAPSRIPSLKPTFLIFPGIVSGSTLSPILHNAINLNQSFWLGRGSFMPGVSQQWALPVHYFCGFSTRWPGAERNLYTEGRSDAFTCGLADLPSGDLFLEMYQGHIAPWVDYRSDLWHHLRTPGPLTLGATLHWSIAPTYYESIAAYYQGLLHAGIIHRKDNSAHKTSVAFTPQFCTWGAQRVRDKANDKLDEAFLTGIYREMKSAGMKAGLFSIDDKWEGAYGNLEHSAERLPHFEQFLAELRADGKRIGMWAAVMRCEKPSDLGLTTEQMLKRPDGTPFTTNGAGGSTYYILDFTQPEVARVLTEVVRRFMRRYKPDLFKFDFGYELPTVAGAAPLDKHWTGERLLWKGLEVVINAMRAENPDIVVMYYNLSPLFLEFIDLHSPDDLWMDIGDYEVEANRRFYFSSLMGQLGVPTYGSSGYDWASSPSIWFDSAALGSIGSLNDFGGDEQGQSSTPEIVARYNGIAQVLRRTNSFEIVPLGAVQYSPTQGAHARSWARIEDGQLVLLAHRPPITEEALFPDTTSAAQRIHNAVSSIEPVIVSSRTNEAIQRSSSLAIVPCGEGEVILKREQGKQAQIVNHYFGGATTSATLAIADNQLRIPVQSHHSSTEPIEWIEVQITF